MGGTLEEQAARIIRTAKRHEEQGEIAAIAKTLSEEEAVEILKLTEDDAGAIRMITRSMITGAKVTNAPTYLQMLRTKLEWTREKPKQQVGVDGAIEVVVKTIAEEYKPDPETSTVALPSPKEEETDG